MKTLFKILIAIVFLGGPFMAQANEAADAAKAYMEGKDRAIAEDPCPMLPPIWRIFTPMRPISGRCLKHVVLLPNC